MPNRNPETIWHKRRISGALLILAVLTTLGIAPGIASNAQAAPQPTAEQIEALAKAPEDVRVRIIITLAKSGQHELAAQLLERYPLQGAYADNRRHFIQGLILKGRRDYTGAVKHFRAALASDPKLTLVRAELANTLVILQQDDGAKHHLELLAADAPTEQAASSIRAFIEQVDERRPYKVDAYVSLAPSTNVNNGSNHSTVYSPIIGTQPISDSSRKDSGLGVAGGVSAGYSKRLGNAMSLVVAGNANARIYADSDYNSFGLSQSAELRYLMERGYVGFGAVGSEALKNDEIGVSYLSYGPRLSASQQVSPHNNVSFSAVHEWRNSLTDDDADGTAILLDASLTHSFDSAFTGTVFGGFDKVKAGLATSSYVTWSGGLATYRELPAGITVNASTQLRYSDFGGNYVLAAKDRHDYRSVSTIELTKRDFEFHGLAPSLSYTYTRNLSNIELFDFDSHSIDFRLTRSF